MLVVCRFFWVEWWVVDGGFGVPSDLEAEVLGCFLVAASEVGAAWEVSGSRCGVLKFSSAALPLLLRGVLGSSGLRSSFAYFLSPLVTSRMGGPFSSLPCRRVRFFF